MYFNKKRSCKLEGDQSRNEMERLPHEIAHDILSRLSITSIIPFRFVCRAWRTLSLDQSLANLHLSEAAKRDPFLIFRCDYPIQNQLYFFEFSDDKSGVAKKISTPFSTSMEEFNVVGSCNGLLCLSDSLYKDLIYICNPFTGDYKELPKTMQYEDQEVVCGFGLHPGTNEYIVVKIVYHCNRANSGFSPTPRIRIPGHLKSDVLAFSLSSNAWRSIGQVPCLIERQYSQATFTNGRLHWLTRSMHQNIGGLLIVCYDLADERFHEVPRPNFSVQNAHNYRLAELRGCLCAVVCMLGELEIWVMKEYNVKESWIKEFRMGAYLPELLLNQWSQSVGIWRNTFNRSEVRVVCILKNGEIMVEYKVGRLALYDPKTKRYNHLMFKGMPKMFQTVAHVGSLNWIQPSN